LLHLQEAQSKFDVEVDPTEAVNIEPSSGVINSEGSASLHFKRTSSSPAAGRINCKVQHLPLAKVTRPSLELGDRYVWKLQDFIDKRGRGESETNVPILLRINSQYILMSHRCCI